MKKYSKIALYGLAILGVAGTVGSSMVETNSHLTRQRHRSIENGIFLSEEFSPKEDKNIVLVLNLFNYYGQVFINQFLGNYLDYSNNNGWNVNEIPPNIEGMEIKNGKKMLKVPTTLNIPICDMISNNTLTNNGFWKIAYEEFSRNVLNLIFEEKLNIIKIKLCACASNLSWYKKYLKYNLSFNEQILNLKNFSFNDFVSSIKISNVKVNSATFSFDYKGDFGYLNTIQFEKPINYVFVEIKSKQQENDGNIVNVDNKSEDNKIVKILNEIENENNLIKEQEKLESSQELLINNLVKKEKELLKKIDLINSKIFLLRNERKLSISELEELNNNLTTLKNELQKVNLEIKNSENKQEEYKNNVLNIKNKIFEIKEEISNEKEKNKNISNETNIINSECKNIEQKIKNDESVISVQNETINSLKSQQINSEEQINKDNLEIENLENNLSGSNHGSGKYIGIGIGIGILITMIIGAFFWYKRRNKNKHS